MASEVIVALIVLFGTMIGTGGGIFVSSKLIVYRIEQLEKKTDKMYSFVESMYKMEQQVGDNKGEIKRLRDAKEDENVNEGDFK